MSQAARQEALLREQEALDAEHEARASIRADVRERLLGLASNNRPHTTQYVSGSLVEYEARSGQGCGKDAAVAASLWC